MALTKRGNIYWIRISCNGKRIQKSTGTSNRKQALELHDKVKAELWRQSNLAEPLKKTWIEATMRWLKESQHKRSLRDDIAHLRWLDPHLKHLTLDAVTRDKVEKLADLKANSGVSNASINRMLAFIRALLNKAAQEWGWINEVPKISLRFEDNRRIRWLSYGEASRLLAELPLHLHDMAAFTLATGLRQSNVKNLKWEDVDLENGHAWIHADQAKARRAIPVPLNDIAMETLKRRLGTHPVYVFTYNHNPIRNVSTRAWKKALKRAEIKDFRWHDLRHTWASWHVQNGTSLQELQQLGGWSNFDMVLRYAHLSGEHLREAASRVPGTFLVQSKKLLNIDRHQCSVTL